MIEIFKMKEIKKDLLFSIIAFFVLILVIFVTKKAHVFSTIVSEKYDFFASMYLTLVGFMVTSLSILINFPENYKIKFLKTHPLFPRVFETFVFATFLFLAIFILSLIGLFLRITFTLYIWLYLFFILWSMIMVFRVIWILYKMSALQLKRA